MRFSRIQSLIIAMPLIAACAASPKRSAVATAARLPFIEDDYPRALAEARAKKLPLFVDVWAPW